MSTTQCMQALERANEIRFARARAKEGLATGRLTFAQALQLDCCQSMRVGDLLAVQHRWGAHRARLVLGECRISGTYTVAQVTARQSALLDAAIARRRTSAPAFAGIREGATALA